MGGRLRAEPQGHAYRRRGDARLDFFTKQVRTSRNIRGGWWATTLLGGLNYQVEHHLFPPSMPRIHLAKARKLVRAKCAQLDVPYTEVSLGRSYATVIEYLNEVGRAAAIGSRQRCRRRSGPSEPQTAEDHRSG